MKKTTKWLKRMFFLFMVFVLLIILTFLILNIFTAASNDRDWNNDQKILPYAKIENNLVSIFNIRNFSYNSTENYTPNYYDKTFDVNKIKRVWYVVEPFSGIPGSAHTFLSFEFEDSEFISISVEIRKEKGETYHPIKGLLNQYELTYVIADEKDVIKLRANHRNDLVYVYPIKTTKEKTRELFLDMIERANKLKDSPEFYNTITNNCTSNIVSHINKITPGFVSFFSLRVIFPENSDKLAYELGLLDTDLQFEEARKRYLINSRSIKYSNDEDYSIKIREEE